MSGTYAAPSSAWWRMMTRATAYVPSTITIRPDPEWGDGAWGGWADDHGVVYLTVYWTRSREVIAHEVGHALGFGHAGTNGAHSVMYDAAHVTPDDCEGLRRYYGT